MQDILDLVKNAAISRVYGVYIESNARLESKEQEKCRKGRSKIWILYMMKVPDTKHDYISSTLANSPEPDMVVELAA